MKNFAALTATIILALSHLASCQPMSALEQAWAVEDAIFAFDAVLQEYTFSFNHGDGGNAIVQVFGVASSSGNLPVTSGNTSWPYQVGWSSTELKGTQETVPFLTTTQWDTSDPTATVWKFQANQLTQSDPTVFNGSNPDDALLAFCILYGIGEGEEIISFKEIAVEIQYDLTASTHFDRLDANAHDDADVAQIYAPDFAVTAQICEGEATSIHPGDPTAVCICTANTSQVSIRRITSLDFSARMPSGTTETQMAIADGQVRTDRIALGDCGLTGTQYCCRVDTVLDVTLFSSTFSSTESNIQQLIDIAGGVVLDFAGGGGERRLGSSRQLQDGTSEATAEFQSTIEITILEDRQEHPKDCDPGDCGRPFASSAARTKAMTTTSCAAVSVSILLGLLMT